MDQLLTQGANAQTSGPSLSRTPTELWERIIDMLYSDITTEAHANKKTLYSCALVCREWRVRSQKNLFYAVQLPDDIAFRRLATILDNGPHLRDYVYQVELTGYYLHNTASIFALFPAVFAGKLPKLERIDVVHLSETETQLSKVPAPSKAKSLQYIPLHPRFASFLSTFTNVSILILYNTVFRSFSEFLRILRALPNFENLTCDSMGWISTGGSHPGADLMQQLGWMTLPPLVPKLSALVVRVAAMMMHLWHDCHRVFSSETFPSMGWKD